MKRPITTRDIADAAGVNQSTVSRALRNAPEVQPATRERIHRLAKEMGYRPNPFVSAFTAQVKNYRRSPHGATIALLDCNPAMSRDFSREYRRGARERAAEFGFKTELFRLHQVGGSLRRMREILWTRGINGVLLLPVNKQAEVLDRGEEFFGGMAASTVDPSLHEPALHRVQPDYYQGMQLCLQKLTEFGYRRPAFCSMRKEVSTIGAQWLGAFAERQMLLPQKQRVEPFLMPDWDQKRFARWMRNEKPDAIVSNDSFFFEWASQLGATPPDFGYASLTIVGEHPEISAINQRSSAVGAAAIDMIVAQIHRNEYGLPSLRKTLLIECEWRDGTTTPGPLRPVESGT